MKYFKEALETSYTAIKLTLHIVVTNKIVYIPGQTFAVWIKHTILLFTIEL